jgi:thiosulfate/3-mercaptopyruvate sulfurtransferase
MTSPVSSPLISVAQLQTLLASGAPCKVFDCSFELMTPNAGDLQYAQSHILGAVRANLDRHLSAAKSAPDAASGGRHPLPSRDTFAQWLGSTGLTPEMTAVVYDRQGANYCGRLWWMLKWAGHENVLVLDGGFQAWQAADGAVDAGACALEAPGLASSGPDDASASASAAALATESAKFKTIYPLAPARLVLTATETVAANLGRACQTMIDARAPARFRGEVEPLDPVAGHLPGALNRPFTQNLDAQGFFKPAATLRAEFEALLAGRDPATVVHHCGSGVSAVPNIIAMLIAGLGPTALYAGSWSDWCSNPGRPFAQG